MASIDGAQIEIINWDKYNPRRDVKASSWLRMDHGLFENPDFYDFSQGELLVWIYLLCVASRKSNSVIKLNLAHAERIGRLKAKDIESAIKKLESLQILLVDVTDTLRASDANDTRTCATNERNERNGRNETRRTNLPTLAEIWNEHSGKLPKVRGCSSTRLKAAQARWSENPDDAHWSEVVKVLAGSEFCNGANDRKWIADFDFLLQPDTQHKALEGKYGARTNSVAINKRQEEAEYQQELARLRSQAEREAREAGLL